MEKNDDYKTKNRRIGIVLRFPIFIIIVFFKVFIAAPFEFIVKLFMLLFFVLVNIMKYKYSVTFNNERLYREWQDEWKDGMSEIFHLNSIDFKATNNFLKNGKFKKE